jgi:hypothetical protein
LQEVLATRFQREIGAFEGDWHISSSVTVILSLPAA